MAFDSFLKRFTNSWRLPSFLTNLWGFEESDLYQSIFRSQTMTDSDSMVSFDCAVCWQKQPIDWSVACTEFDIPDFISADISDDDFSDDDDDESETELVEINDSNAEVSPKKQCHTSHRFCAECIRGLARNACDDAPLAKGGIGLCCMERECSGVLLLSSFRQFLTVDLLVRLEERMQYETIVHAQIKNFERCSKCPSGQIMHSRPFLRRNLKFVCQACNASHCRLCKIPWKRIHSGRTCWEFKWAMTYRYGWDKNSTPAFVDTDTANKLTDNIIRQCPKCNVSFMKSSGCNKMVCRCGETQCYACRAVGVDYTHYCNCTSMKGRKECCDKCDLFDDVKARERRTRDDLLSSAKRRHESGPMIVKNVTGSPASSSSDYVSSPTTSTPRFTAPKRINRRH